LFKYVQVEEGFDEIKSMVPMTMENDALHFRVLQLDVTNGYNNMKMSIHNVDLVKNFMNFSISQSFVHLEWNFNFERDLSTWGVKILLNFCEAFTQCMLTTYFVCL